MPGRITPYQAGLLDGVLDDIQQRISDYFSSAWEWMFSPLWRWYFLFGVLVVVGGAVIYFLGWLKPVRMIVGTLVAAAAVFVAGGHVMYTEEETRRHEDHQRLRELEKERREQEPKNSGWW